MILNAKGIHANIYEIKAIYPTGGMGLSARQMKDIGARYGLQVKVYRANQPGVEPLMAAGLPVIAHYKREHYVIITEVTSTHVCVMDPASGLIQLSHGEFLSAWSGVYFLTLNDAAGTAMPRPYGLTDEVIDSLKGNHSAWALMVMVALVTAATVITIPWLLSKALTIFAYGTGSIIQTLLVGFAIMLAMLVFAQWLRARASVSIQMACDNELTKRFISKIIALPLTAFMTISPGDFISRINAVVAVRDFLTSRISSLFVDTVIIIATLAALMTQSALIVLAFIILSGITCIFLMCLRERMKIVVAEELITYTRYYECATETLSSAVDIKATGKAAAFERRWHLHFDNHQRAVGARGKLGAVIDAIYAYQERVVPIASLLLVASIAPKGSVEDTRMFFSYFLMIWTAPSLRSLQAFSMQLVATSINNERIRSITTLNSERMISDHKPVLVTVADARTVSVEISDITFSYRGTGALVLDKFSCSFESVGLKIVIGPSGSGKSTLLRLIAGLLSPDGGALTIRHPEVTSNASVIGYLNQHPSLFAGSLIENISLFDESPDYQRVAQCARLACIHEEIMELPDQYNTSLSDRGNELSSGQRQRVALARLFYIQPSILLLDEFTSDVDIECEKAIIENLRNMDMMIIIATHRQTWIKDEDTIVSLRR